MNATHRSTVMLVCSTLLCSFGGTVSSGQATDVRAEQELRELAAAQLRARQRLTGDPASLPVALAMADDVALESVPVGHPGLSVYRALDLRVTHPSPLLVGWDGKQVLALGGFEAPELSRAADALGLRLRGEVAVDLETALELARLADPNGGLQVQRPTASDTARVRQFAAWPPDTLARVRGSAVRITVMSLRPGFAEGWELLTFVFEADSRGRLQAWGVRRVPPSLLRSPER